MKSILDLAESEIVTFIVKEFGDTLFKELGITHSVKIIYEAKGIIENGDLDILFIDPYKPSESILLECKRIKVKIEEDQSEKVNKKEELKKLVIQVNERIRRGFHKVYCTVIIVSDGRNKIANNIFFNYASSNTREAIYTSKYLKKLDTKAGILFLEPSQLTAKDYKSQGSCGFYIMKEPTLQQQPKELTEKILSLV